MGSINPLTPEQATQAIERTVKAVMQDITTPALVQVAEREARQTVYGAVRYYMQTEGWKLAPFRTWRLGRWTLTVSRDARRRA